MRPTNTRLAVLVASAAVAAVAIGGVLAYRQEPRFDSDTAAPLPGGPRYTGPVKVPLKLNSLPTGRVPQIPYLVGREVRGGAGEPVKIPGTDQIQEIARLGGTVLAVVTKGTGTQLLKIRYDGFEPERIADVTSIATTDDQRAAAYAATRTGSGGQALRGGTLYAEVADVEGELDKLSLPKAWNVQVLAYVDGKVWFRWAESDAAMQWNLSTWAPGASTSTLIKTVPSPLGISRDGRLAASRAVAGDSGTCSVLTEVATGKRLWRSCEYQPTAFTPDGTVAVGAPAYQDGYADLQSSALEVRTGNLLRQWTGLSFRRTVVEDDQHFLMEADDGPETKGALVRCALLTGQCELATPISTTQVMLSS